MRHCAVVIAGNQYLADRAKQAGSKNIVKVPTVVSESVFFPKESGNAIPVIGWIGSMSTAVYLSEIRSALVELQKKYDFQFRVVGAQLDWPELAVDNVPWSEGQEVAAVQSFDIGVMPLIDSYWERGKCGFKLVQYMACGKAVVADPVGVNVEIVDDGANGFLISAERTWYQALEALLQDAALRQSMGEQGRTRFQRKYSLETWREVILKVFYDVVSPKEKR
jgi:glycosyltransferase involved in cell wall biosynthesis